MLKITIGEDAWNEAKKEFDLLDPIEIEFEHSLISLSKWESKYQKPFLSDEKKTVEEVFGYIHTMILSPEISFDVLVDRLTNENVQTIQAYIDSPESATTFGSMPERRGRGEVITSELIYYWMVAFNIPFEVEYWHLNRLFSLVRICNIKNQSNNPKEQRRLSKSDLEQRRALNEQRRKELNTRG